MATYYVRKDGNDTNAGTGSAPNQAWQTVQKALGATGIVSGDTVYIAPGIYSEQITVGMTNPTATTSIIGNPTSSLFPGVNAGQVIITNLNSTLSANSYTGTVVTSSSKNFLSWQNISFKTYGNILMNAASSRNLSFIKCSFNASNSINLLMTNSAPTSSALNLTIQDCIFINGSTQVVLSGSNIADTNNIQTSVFIGASTFNIDATSIGGIVTNNAFLSGGTRGVNLTNGSVTFPLNVQNNLFMGSRSIDLNCGGVANAIVENYNRLLGVTPRGNVANNGTSSTSGDVGIDVGESLLFGLNNLQPFTSIIDSPNKSFGTASNAPATDIYDVTWTGTSPDAGAGTYRVITSNPTNIQYNGGVERNASTITIAPGSTSQSIELYLGATGLTASTSGLSAYYNRTRSADVQIPLVARNITQNWTSGGFAEVNANTMPGVYRLDIPNEALAAGADDVTVVVRGASGTNGAVMSIKLSSGGLTTAQTASAVWGALTNDHTTHGTFGWNVLRADQDSKEGLVTLHQSGGISRVDADVHAIANDTAAATALKGALNHDGTGYVDSDVVRISTSTAAANELEGALLHNGTDYIDSNLLSGNSTRVFVGRFQLTQTGTTQGDIIEAFTTDTPSFELQLFDGDNNIVPVTGATLGLRILDVTSTVVETGTPTIEYGTGGIVRWTAPGSYVSIGCPAGMYRLFVDRTVSGTTTTFGPLQIKVQVQ